MKFKGILFDFDGVVVKSMEQHYDAWSKAFAEKGISVMREEFYLLEGQGVDTIAKILGTRNGLTEEESLHVLASKVRFYYRQEKTLFYDHFFSLIERLQQVHTPMAVVTGGNRDRVYKVLDKHLPAAFQAVITIDDVTHGKPHPEPYLNGAQALGLSPADCIVIENAPLGIKAAREAGCRVIAILTTLAAEHLREAHYLAADFREVERLLFQNG